MKTGFWLAAFAIMTACYPNAPASTKTIGASQSAPGCSAGLITELDRSSFTAPGLTAARLASFTRSAEQAFKSAANALCRSKLLDPAAMRAFRRLLIQSGSGAVDTAVYSEPESFGHETLVFQWIFSEEDLGLPDKADIEAGILCWVTPDSSQCLERMP